LSGKARVNAPEALHHIIVRGIERARIFRNSADRDDFLNRLGNLVVETKSRCFALALLLNHFYLLIKTGRVPVSTLMRQLLTGYAVLFKGATANSDISFRTAINPFYVRKMLICLSWLATFILIRFALFHDIIYYQLKT